MNHIRRFALYLCLLPLFYCGTGCQMLQEKFSDPATIDFVAKRAKNAAQIGVALDLKARPEHRLAFEAAVVALDGLLNRGDFTGNDLSAVLSVLPLDGGELQGDEGVLLIGQVAPIIILDIATLFGFNIDSLPALKAIAGGIRDGIKAGLASPVVKTRDITSPSEVPGKRFVPVKLRRI